jgi:hypothetical protein
VEAVASHRFVAVLEKAAGRRGQQEHAPGGRCTECGEELAGRANRLVCSRRCKDSRYARLHPEELRAKERRKYERRLLREG